MDPSMGYARAGALMVLLVATLVISCGPHHGEAHPSSPAKLNQYVQDPSKTADEKLSKLCKNIGSIRHISLMEHLIDNLKKVLGSKQFASLEEQPARQVSFWLPNLSSPDPMYGCIQQAESILALEPILRERSDVCQPSHIDLMESYYRRFIADTSPGPRLTSRFFTLYSSQVVFLCKTNMLAPLRWANKHFINKDDYNKVMPWLSAASGELCPKSQLQQEGSQLAGPSNDTIQRCSARQALAEIKSINELVEALDALDSVSMNATDGSADHDQSLFMIISKGQEQVIDNVLASCRKFEFIYARSVMPIVRLVHLGYNPRFDNFDKMCIRNQFVQRWFSITLICSSMLRLGDKRYGTSADLDETLVIVDKAEQPAGDSDAKGNQDESQRNEQQKMVLENPIEDELWVSLYVSNTMSKLKAGLYKKISKIFKLESVEDHIVFRQKMSDTGRCIISIILVSLAIVGINSIA